MSNDKVFRLFEGWRRFKNADYYSVHSTPFYGPPPLINDVIDCWAQEGVRFFTELHNANGMSYHTTLPTEELEFHIERPLNHHDYSNVAEQLIENGIPGNAVRIKVGKNGKAIIERDADIVMAAKHVGMPELPVLFSFQNEV
jgi:hypothetical protein